MPVVGENTPTVTINQSQATPPDNVTKVNTPGSGPQPVPTSPTATNVQPGTGAPTDDGSVAPTVAANVAVGALNNSIVPQENILSNYSSYTYSLTWYLVTPEALSTLQQGDASVLATQTIIIQSGGINNDQRNAYFDVDFYFEDLRFKSVLAGGGSSSASNSYELEFTVIEPNGITLLPRLQKAIDGVIGTSGGKQQILASQNFVLVIKFYGYDTAGNLLQVGQQQALDNQTRLTQKILPFQISDFEFKVDNKLVEYRFKGVITNTFVATATNQNTLMYNAELSGMTVKEVLTTGTTATTGNAGTGTTTTTGRINDGATPKNTVRLGLVSALNQYQQNLVANGSVTYPHTYVIEFTDPAIANASVTVKDGRTKSTGMPLRGGAPEKLDPRRQSMDPTVRLLDFTAGQQITQIIEQTIRNSTYVTDQSNLRVAETTQKTTPRADNGLTWFKVSFQATPKQYDSKRNDYAYTIRYVVSKFTVQNLISPYFKPSPFTGVHKSYNYWFTGLNTEVLHYEQKYTPQYSVTIGNQADTGSSQTNEMYKQNAAPRSGQTAQGASGRTNDIAANAADFLYSTDLTNAEITILGDPAWIPQGEVVALPPAGNWVSDGFLPDGTINFSAGQVLFEIAINAPSDYDLSTGLMDPDTQISGMIDNIGQQNQPRRRYVYNAVEVESIFNKGEFTQHLKGLLVDELSKLREQQIAETVGKETREGVFDRTPSRQIRTTNTAAQVLINGQTIPNTRAANPNPQRQAPTLPTPINIQPNQAARAATSNGIIESLLLPAAQSLITNTVTQLINREY